MKIVLGRENMTKQRHKVGVRRREGKRRGEGCILAGGGVSIRRALSLINLLLCGMRMWHWAWRGSRDKKNENTRESGEGGEGGERAHPFPSQPCQQVHTKTPPLQHPVKIYTDASIQDKCSYKEPHLQPTVYVHFCRTLTTKWRGLCHQMWHSGTKRHKVLSAVQLLWVQGKRQLQ